ncbi:MAG: choice-of-anchor B family protein [Bacteroidetes bacterium]|nr:choice-of-anchor B family protein [Bacteroidota bacterium]
MKKLFPFGILFFIPYSLFLIPCAAQNMNITLAAQLSYGSQELSNIWGWKSPVDGKEYALVGAANGLSIVNVTNPSSPVQIVEIAPQDPASTNCSWREVKTWGNYAYVTTECGQTGLQIIDLTNLPSPSLPTVNWKPAILDSSIMKTDTLKTIHALHIDNGKLYLYGSNLSLGGALVADVNTTPMNPVYLGSYSAGGYIHDGYVQNDTMYAGHIWAGTVEIVDMKNPSNGIPLASFSTPGNFTHNTWLSSNGKTCFTTDEINGGYLASFDVSNFSNITQLDTFRTDPGSGVIVHNTYIIKKNGIDYAVTSWYKDGIIIADVSNPSNIKQVGNYDTSPLSGSGYGGCWGVYPYLPSGIIIASDIEQGLFVLNPTYVSAPEINSAGAGVSVYPNPSADGKFTVSGLWSGVQIQVYNVFGEKVYSTIQPSNHSTASVYLPSGTGRGIYFYRLLSTDGKEITGKLIIE